MRARNLKPKIFKNELLAVADPLYTVIFEGLWCLADREGRLEDKPAKIHFEINPGRAFETTERSLAWLYENGFILRYQVGKSSYIQVITFKDHQNPHQKEPPSKIPAFSGTATEASDKSGASPVQAQDMPNSGPADSGLRTPESPFPLPDSPLLVTATPNTHEPDHGAEFVRLKTAYPNFSGRQDWITAEHHCRLRLERDGLTWQQLQDAVSRYRAYCDSGGVSGPQFVMTPAKFFSGVDKPWAQEWKPPPNKAQVKQDKNISVAQRWLDRQNDAAQ